MMLLLLQQSVPLTLVRTSCLLPSYPRRYSLAHMGKWEATGNISRENQVQHGYDVHHIQDGYTKAGIGAGRSLRP